MGSQWFLFAEIFLVKGAIFAFIVREYYVTNRLIKQRKAEKARAAARALAETETAETYQVEFKKAA